MHRNLLSFVFFLGLQISPLCAQQATLMKPVVTRTMKTLSGTNAYQVTIKIQTNDASGFGRYSEQLPDSVTISDTDLKLSSGAMSQQGKKLLFTWTSLPVNREEIIAYTITFKGPPSSSQLNYPGILAYVTEGQACSVKAIVYTTPKKSVRLIQH
ncbi:MAG TPA: hypothetical protein VNZ86_12790 [Bacteroidia bacterium]|jgi:hypothetical protein|nr:hypothetical protein [Bacteroidia bacterium]